MLTWYLITKNVIMWEIIIMPMQITNICMIKMEQNKLHTFNILNLTMNTDRFYYNHFLMPDLTHEEK